DGTYGHGRFNLWDVGTGKGEWGHTEVGEILSALAFAPDGKTVVAGGFSGITWFDASTGKVRRTGKDHPGGFQALAFAPDSKVLVSGGNQGGDNVFLWDAATGALLQKLAGHQSPVAAVAFT